ncbi:MAG: 3-dehydroquinate synthase II [Candidatus Thermoplasmatota archaeon]|nr:3-dehydroquinate synthase II [Candidatus Thermoplasmatota archaeon]
MEIWLRPNDGERDAETDKVDRVFSENATQEHLRAVDGVLYQGERVLGAHVIINDGATQDDGIAHMGTVDWIMVECETWSMIPLENLIAHRSGSHTKIAAVINTPLEAQGAGFALEQGVDALVISSEPAMLEAALSVKAQRLERLEPNKSLEAAVVDSLQLAPLSVQSVEQAGLGDRYCLDFLSSFSQGEGILVGSSARTLFLVHSETIPSTFVPTRPFRVNAGAPHTYVMMGDGTTKYMAELEAGDNVLAVSTSGETRKVVLGRVKIEQRPMVKITGRKINILQQNDNTSHVFMQQAETVRLVSEHLHAVAVTELQPGQLILGWEGHDARHVGVPIQGGIEER